MVYELDKIDTAIINSLMEDGRKSFRQISREIRVSTPTVKARFQRLLDMGLVKSVVPILDTSKLKHKREIKIQTNTKIKNSVLVKLTCDYCDGPINAKPTILKFANIERFLCCSSCKTLYKEKYKGRIESLTRQYKNLKNN